MSPTQEKTGLPQGTPSNAEKPLPQGWRWLRLGDVCEAQTGTCDPSFHPNETFSYVIGSVDNVQKRITQYKRLLGKDAPSRARQRIRTGDVLVSTTRPNLNAVATVPRELDGQVCSTGFCVLRACSDLDATFLFCHVQSPGFIESLSGMVKGALYPGVTDRQVFAQSIPLPPLAEQKRIAGMLSEQMAQVQQARKALQAQLQAAAALLAACLREVFNSPQVQAWPKKRLGDFAETCSGATPSRAKPEYYTGAIPWVKTGELKDGVIEDTEEHVSDVALRECSLPLVPADTLLIAMYGQGQTRGRTAVLLRPATTNQACFAIRPDATAFDTPYLQLWFQHSYERLRRETEGRGGNQPNLNGIVLRGLEVQLPTVDKQRRVARILRQQMATARAVRAPLESQLAALDHLPAALLRRAFAGEV